MKLDDRCSIYFSAVFSDKGNFGQTFRTDVIAELNRQIRLLENKISELDNPAKNKDKPDKDILDIRQSYETRKGGYVKLENSLETSLRGANWQDFGFPMSLNSPLVIRLKNSELFLFISYDASKKGKWEDERIEEYLDYFDSLNSESNENPLPN